MTVNSSLILLLNGVAPQDHPVNGGHVMAGLLGNEPQRIAGRDAQEIGLVNHRPPVRAIIHPHLMHLGQRRGGGEKRGRQKR